MTGRGWIKDEDIVDGLSIWYLKSSGLWGILNHHRATGERSKVLMTWMIGMVIGFAPLILVTVAAPFFTERDLENMTQIVLNPISTIQVVAKFGILWYQMEKQVQLLELLKKNYLGCVPEDKKAGVSKILARSAKEASFYSWIAVIANFSTVALWNTIPVLRSEYVRLTLGITIFGSPTGHSKILGLWYPFDFDASPANQIVYVYEFALGFCAAFIITLMEGLVVQVIVMLTGYLKAFQYLMKEFKNNHNSELDKEQLLLYIKDHQKLMSAGDSVCELYNFLITVQLSTGLFILIIGIFNFFMAGSSGNGDVVMMVKFVVYTMYTLVEVCFYCYTGSNLEATSEDVCVAAYSCEWYEMGVDFRKTLQMMMLRSRSPVALKAGRLYTVNLTTLNNILRMAYSTSMLLYRVKVPEEGPAESFTFTSACCASKFRSKYCLVVPS